MDHLDDMGLDRVRAGEGDPSEAEHVLACLNCKIEVEVLRYMANSMKDAQAVDVPVEIDRAVLSSLPTRRRRPAWAVFAGSAAAVLAIALTLTFVTPAHADVVDAYALAVKGGDAKAIMMKCTKLRSPRKLEIGGNRFVAVDVYLEAGEKKLAAWQVEVATGDRATIVGVEGGEPAAYREPPTFDPEALQGGKIILAAFTTKEAPSGRVRVARLHLMESEKAALEGKVVAAAAPGGARFEAKVTLERTGEAR